MKIIFSKLASQELNDASCYYELSFEGLGKKFRDEIKKTVLRISEYPEAWPLETNEVRKYCLHKFPYKILYSIEENHLFIIAIAHQHRKPDYWS
jgi:mRNA-degrading endonuclease RelE of RelBE toxin-antitoxin system